MSQVSGIEVRFSANTAPLEQGVSRAQGAISNFAKGAAASLAGALSAGMFIAAGKAAIDFADTIGKMSQKVGMTTEELSKLAYAAKLSDVSMGELQVGVQQLAKNMEAGSEGLAALGISATDSSGNLRSTSEVMIEVAEAFAGMEDGAGKTAIAMNIFGRSGAQLIPMLNAGRGGLAQMANEAERLGVVISGDAARSAETFNDNLTRLKTASEGLAQQIINPLLPTLIKLTERFLELSDTGTSVGDWFQRMSSWFESLDPRIATTRKEIEWLAGALENLGLIEGMASPKSDFQGVMPGAGGISATREDVDAMVASAGGASGKSKAPSLRGAGESIAAASENTSPVPGVPGVDAIDPFFIERLAAIQEGFQTEREILAEEYAANQEVLRGALDNQLLTEEEYRRLSEQMEKDHQGNLAAIRRDAMNVQLSAAADLFGSLAQLTDGGNKKLMKLSKAFSAAQVVINTAQGISKAFAQFGWPAGIAPAAAVAASGAAQLASIASAESGKIKGVGGARGGGGRGKAEASGGASGGGGPTTTFQFTLMNDPMGFGEKFARQFIDQLNSTQRNGGQIRGVIA